MYKYMYMYIHRCIPCGPTCYSIRLYDSHESLMGSTPNVHYSIPSVPILYIHIMYVGELVQHASHSWLLNIAELADAYSTVYMTVFVHVHT